ncbi:MAG: hypothetical protein DMF91_10165 [Acidobacteria bacterium]|nr:MAG: hypothetical protein DMF91_10165 [Acidobacteriota bacterium]
MNVRVILYCTLGGGPLLLGALGAGQWTAWWLAGIVLALAFVPVALFGPRSVPGQFGTVAVALLIITALCTWSEALIFLPIPEIREHPFQPLIGSCVMYLVVAAVLAVLAKLLRLSRESASDPEPRGFVGAALMVLLCGIAYVLYYLVFGALTYEFFTKGYYPDATRTVANLGWWFWIIQFARGVLMTLATVPIIYTLRLPRVQTAVAVGAVIWIAGGLAPLLIPNPFMGLTQRLIHVAEIFTQNFSLGVTAALLLRTER